MGWIYRKILSTRVFQYQDSLPICSKLLCHLHLLPSSSLLCMFNIQTPRTGETYVFLIGLWDQVPFTTRSRKLATYISFYLVPLNPKGNLQSVLGFAHKNMCYFSLKRGENSFNLKVIKHENTF